MEKHNDIATCPELFDGVEQFVDEQISLLKRTGAIVVLVVAIPGALFVLQLLQHFR